MPTLKQITCSLELGPSNTKLKEYGHRYTDGGVEAYIAVPDVDLPFNIHVTSTGYIAPGLAVWVYIDGRYQCNRNRHGLLLPDLRNPTIQSEIDFRLRQKEENASRGLFIGRGWNFTQLRRADVEAGGGSSSLDKNFAENVGTIEVVVCRCKDGPAFCAIAQPGPTSRQISGASIVRQLKSVKEEIEPARTPSRAHIQAPSKAPFRDPQKAPSKAPSIAASSKKACAAGEDMMGGMFGVFDGAGDAPGHDQFVPVPVFLAEAPLPRRRDERPFSDHYRDDHRHMSCSAYRDRAQVLPGHLPRPARADESPFMGYYQQYRPRAATDYFPRPSRTLPPHLGDKFEHRGQIERSRSLHDGSHHEASDDFDFIVEMSEQMDAIYKRAYEERTKFNDLQQEVQSYSADPGMQLTAMKACRLQEHQVHRLDADMQDLIHAIIARMSRMNYESWHRARKFLVVERRLLPSNHPSLQQWRDPAMPISQLVARAPSARSNRDSRVQGDEWQEQGEFCKSGRNWHKVDQQSHRGSKAGSPAKAKSAKGGWYANDAADQRRDGVWGSNDAVDQPQDDRWTIDNCGDAVDKPQGTRGGWNNEPVCNAWDDGNESKKSQSQNGDNKADWGDNNNIVKPEAKTAWSNAGWANDSKANAQSNRNAEGWVDEENKSKSRNKPDNAGWGDGNHKGADNWGGDRDETKSQSHHGKVQKWNDGSKVNGDGWAGQDNKVTKSQGIGGEWGAPEAGEAATADIKRRKTYDGTVTQLEPVVKPYWADWDQTGNSSVKLRPRPRDPYQYPAPSAPALPASGARGVKYGVQAGKGAEYAHRTFNPEYIDPMSKPYAIFTFKYRSKAQIEKQLGRKIDESDIRQAVKESEREDLLRRPKHELVQEMMKMRMAGGNVRSKTPSKPTSTLKSTRANSEWDQKDASKKPVSTKPASNNDWGKAPSNKPVSNNNADRAKAALDKQASSNNRGWDKLPSNRPASNNDWKSAAIKSSKKNAGDGWGGDEKKHQHKGNGWSAGSAENNNGGWSDHVKSAFKNSPSNGGWDNDNSGGDGAWRGTQEAASKATVDHFGPGDGLQQTKSQERVPRDQGWAEAGW